MIILLNVLHVLYHICLALVGGVLGAKFVHKRLEKKEKNK